MGDGAVHNTQNATNADKNECNVSHSGPIDALNDMDASRRSSLVLSLHTVTLMRASSGRNPAGGDQGAALAPIDSAVTPH
jgi:hypothetical protein